jgi:hypothetical protein
VIARFEMPETKIKWAEGRDGVEGGYQCIKGEGEECR